MIRINLLPFRAARKKENIRRQVSVFLLSLMLITAVLFYVNIYLGIKVDDLTTKVEKTKTELAYYKKMANEVDTIKKQLDNLRKKTQVIQNLERNRKEPVRLLDTMTQVVVEKRMWFTSLQADTARVNIDGVAVDNKTVADFMTQLEQCGLFSSVNLNTLKQTAVQKDMNLKSFSISCARTPLN